MTEHSKRRMDELRYSLERNNFILSILTARVLVILYADGVGEPDSQTSIIEKISPQYVSLVRSLRNRFPNDTAEELAQELYNMVYIEDNGYKRDFSHFRSFDEDLLNTWHELRAKQQQLFSDRIALDSILTDAQHAYYSVYGKDIEWKEIEEKNEQLEQQEEEPDEQTQFQRDAERLGEIEEQERRMDLLTELIRNNEITPEIAFKYIHDESMDFDTFLRVLDVWMERQDERTDEYIES